MPVEPLPPEPDWGELDLSDLHAVVKWMHAGSLRSVEREARWTAVQQALQGIYTEVYANRPLSAALRIDALAKVTIGLVPSYAEALQIVTKLPQLRVSLSTGYLSPQAQERVIGEVRGMMDTVAQKIGAIRQYRETTVGTWLPNAERALRFRTALMLSARRREGARKEAYEDKVLQALAYLRKMP